MYEPNPHGAEAAFQAEDAEHVIVVDERAEVLVAECFQDEDGGHSPITPPAPPPVRPAASRAPAPS
jgi:hypothetical protein